MPSLRMHAAKRFKGPEQQEQFVQLSRRRIMHKKKFYFNSMGDCIHVSNMILSRKGNVLVNPPRKLHYEFMREFYANIMYFLHKKILSTIPQRYGVE